MNFSNRLKPSYNASTSNSLNSIFISSTTIGCEYRTGNDPVLCQALAFDTLVALAADDILEFVGTAAGPRDHHAFHHISFRHTKSDGQLRLREITGAAFHHARLRRPSVENPNRGADRVAV